MEGCREKDYTQDFSIQTLFFTQIAISSFRIEYNKFFFVRVSSKTSTTILTTVERQFPCIIRMLRFKQYMKLCQNV